MAGSVGADWTGCRTMLSSRQQPKSTGPSRECGRVARAGPYATVPQRRVLAGRSGPVLRCLLGSCSLKPALQHSGLTHARVEDSSERNSHHHHSRHAQQLFALQPSLAAARQRSCASLDRLHLGSARLELPWLHCRMLLRGRQSGGTEEAGAGLEFFPDADNIGVALWAGGKGM